MIVSPKQRIAYARIVIPVVTGCHGPEGTPHPLRRRSAGRRDTHGQLGIGTTEVSRGRAPASRGDGLPDVDLGTGRTATAIVAGYLHTCAILEDASIKCWGANDFGQLGLGDVAARGASPTEMGDALPSVAVDP